MNKIKGAAGIILVVEGRRCRGKSTLEEMKSVNARLLTLEISVDVGRRYQHGVTPLLT